MTLRTINVIIQENNYQNLWRKAETNKTSYNCDVAGFFLMRTQPLLQSMGSESENDLRSRKWTKDHDIQLWQLPLSAFYFLFVQIEQCLCLVPTVLGTLCFINHLHNSRQAWVLSWPADLATHFNHCTTLLLTVKYNHLPSIILGSYHSYQGPGFCNGSPTINTGFLSLYWDFQSSGVPLSSSFLITLVSTVSFGHLPLTSWKTEWFGQVLPLYKLWVYPSMPASLALLIFSSTSCHKSLAHLLDLTWAIAFSILLRTTPGSLFALSPGTPARVLNLVSQKDAPISIKFPLPNLMFYLCVKMYPGVVYSCMTIQQTQKEVSWREKLMPRFLKRRRGAWVA